MERRVPAPGGARLGELVSALSHGAAANQWIRGGDLLPAPFARGLSRIRRERLPAGYQQRACRSRWRFRRRRPEADSSGSIRARNQRMLSRPPLPASCEITRRLKSSELCTRWNEFFMWVPAQPLMKTRWCQRKLLLPRGPEVIGLNGAVSSPRMSLTRTLSGTTHCRPLY